MHPAFLMRIMPRAQHPWDPSYYDRSPLVAIWETTRACDLACAHCRVRATPERDAKELSTIEALDLIDQLHELEPGVVVLTGGDPLKRPDLFLLMATLARRGLRVSLAPSVTPLLSHSVVRHLPEVGVTKVALSLDGPNAATHDGFRGVPGSFTATVRGMDEVRAASLSLQINTSLSSANIAHLRGIATLVGDLRPDLWSVFFVVPVGRATAQAELSADACEEAFHLLYGWSEAAGVAVKTTAAPAYRRVVLQRDAAAGQVHRRLPMAVNDGKGCVFISHTGEVFPSGFLPLSAGSVRKERLADIYRTSSLFCALRARGNHEGKCARCPFWSVCGGSRARAWATTGRLFAEDPACAYQPRCS